MESIPTGRQGRFFELKMRVGFGREKAQKFDRGFRRLHGELSTTKTQSHEGFLDADSFGYRRGGLTSTSSVQVLLRRTGGVGGTGCEGTGKCRMPNVECRSEKAENQRNMGVEDRIVNFGPQGPSQGGGFGISVLRLPLRMTLHVNL